MSQEKDVRMRMCEALAKFNIKQVDVARQAGIHHSTLSLWLQGKVKGHHIGIEDTLSQWLQNLYTGKNRYTTLNKTTDKQFILTPQALNIKRKQKPTQNNDILIPVHLDLDLEIEGKKYKEVFCWNINDPYYTPEQYAKLIVTQNSLLALYQSKIVEAIRRSISEYYRSGKNLGKQPCLKIILLDVRIGNICLKDRFEWDINDSENCPQDFAYSLCKELNLNGQFMVKIAHQIRQQVEYYRKITQNQGQTVFTSQMDLQNSSIMDLKKSTRHLVQYAGNYSSEQEKANLPTPQNFVRQNDFDWEPQIQILDAGQIKKFQNKEERKNRYARRTR